MNQPQYTDEPPQTPTAGVWLPTSLAHKLFHCFYGGGPRVDGSVPHVEAPSRHPFPTKDPTDSFQVPTIQRHHDLHPQGAARLKEPSS